MKKHIQSFNLGINQDVSTNKYSNQNFYWAQNFRFVSKDGLATGAMTNVKGTSSKLSLGTGHSVVGTCQIRDTLILFVNSDEGGKIYIWEYEDSDYDTGGMKLIYTDSELDFATDKTIRAVGRYETPYVQKIYFTDGETYFRHLNIINTDWDGTPWGENTLNPKYIQLDYDLDSLDLVPDVSFSTMDLSIESGGNLKAGKIQYAYQLYNRRGSETTISPESKMISLTSSSESGSSSIDYKGDDVGTLVNKSIQITVDDIDSLFERIRVYALEYTVYGQVPAIRTVGEYDIESNSVTVLDSGQSIENITLEEFRYIQNNFYPKSIDIKDNILFAGNTTEDYFRLTSDEFDSRAFRFDSFNTATVYNGNNSFDITYSSGNLSTLPDWEDECYNDFNSVHSVYKTETSKKSISHEGEEILFKYNPATGELGGYGPNISYEFTTNKVLLDEGTKSNRGFRSAYPRITCEVGTRENYSNPELEAGYQRDEVYRFAFVPIDTKGREGFAMWIGDIKFPNNTELPFVVYENNKTYANILGIKFTVNIPEDVKDKISGYRIVRVERNKTDRTILSQGIIGYLANGGPDSSDKYHMMSQASVPMIGDMYNEHGSYSRVTQDLSLSGDDNDPSGSDQYTRDADGNLPIEPAEKGFNPKFIEFTSPEVAFNKTEFDVSEAFIEAFGVLDENDSTAMSGPEFRIARNRNQLVSDKFKGFSAGNNNKRTRTFIKDSTTYIAREFKGGSDDPDNDVTVHIVDEGRIFNNKTSNLVNTQGDNYRRYGLRGVFNLCTVDSDYDDIDTNKLPLDEFYNGNKLEVVIANYKIDKGKSQYGGSDFEARSYNTYYPVTEFIDKDTTVVEAYRGDTYINFMSYVRSLFGTADPEDGDTIEAYVFFPVESSINLNLRLDDIQNYINWGWYGINNAENMPTLNYTLSETVQQGVLAYGTSYPQEVGDLYRYNSAYSSFNKGKEYTAEPFDFTEQEIFDTRITASDVKINGEYTDSWTKFKFNNYIDIDSKHNAITKIITFKNQLYYFQPTAVGIVAINQRSLVQDEQSGKLTVGTGGILSRYDYITDKSGSEFYNAILGTDDYLFYGDGRRKRVNKIVPGKEIAVSIVKGIDSTLDKLAWDTCVAGFDRRYNEVIFSIDGTTIAFSEMADAFTSNYTFNPKLMFSIGGEFYSVAEDYDESPWLFGDLEDDKVGYSGDTDTDLIGII